jgi:hypothetical protein
LNPFFLAAALAALATQAAAAPPDGPAAADPGASVPRMAYRSVFQNTPTGVEPEAVDWKKANADVGQFPRGHIDLLKWEETQGRPPAAAPGPAAAPSRPAAPPAAPGHKH